MAGGAGRAGGGGGGRGGGGGHAGGGRRGAGRCRIVPDLAGTTSHRPGHPAPHTAAEASSAPAARLGRAPARPAGAPRPGARGPRPPAPRPGARGARRGPRRPAAPRRLTRRAPLPVRRLAPALLLFSVNAVQAHRDADHQRVVLAGRHVDPVGVADPEPGPGDPRDGLPAVADLEVLVDELPTASSRPPPARSMFARWCSGENTVPCARWPPPRRRPRSPWRR